MCVTQSRNLGPIVQVALDTVSIADAVRLADMAVRAGVDWLEVGTPLLAFEGVKAVGALSQAFPGVPVLADFKMMDGVRRYVVETARQGGQLATICGVASDASLRVAIRAGREAGIRIVVDLYAAPDMVRRAVEVEAMGADLVYVHFGTDARAEDPSQDTIGVVSKVRSAVSVPVGASSFDIDGGVAAVRAGADVVVIGHPLISAPNNGKLLTEFVQRVREVYAQRRSSDADPQASPGRAT
jgi:3-hexulose-6-phosphate synthase/6-phospho-3-hexuloisomerase